MKSQNSAIRKQATQIKMWPKDVYIYPTKEDRQVRYKHLKRYCTSYITREMQI